MTCECDGWNSVVVNHKPPPVGKDNINIFCSKCNRRIPVREEKVQ
jgi:hypothetical protein